MFLAIAKRRDGIELAVLSNHQIKIKSLVPDLPERGSFPRVTRSQVRG
jgi:hypothetical protein